MNEFLKVPPHSLEAERSVIGAVLLDSESLHFADVRAEDFYRSDHRTIWRAILACDEPDIVTVGDKLEAAGELENVGGLAYLSELQIQTPTAKNIGRYADVVREKARLREAISVGNEIADAGFNGTPADVANAVSRAMMRVYGAESKNHWDTRASTEIVLERADKASRGELAGIPFGIEHLDRKYPAGMEPGDLIVMGGRPSMGKTAVMVNMALKASCPVGFVSLEMGHEQITRRALGIMAQVPYTKINMGEMSQPEWDRLGNASVEYVERQIKIADLPGATAGEIVQSAMLMKHQHNIGLLMVDYLQLVKGDASNRAEEIGDISRQMKALAKRLQIPVVLASQLNRKLEERSNKRPIMSDLRESGQIEQDADMIIFLYRDAIYNDVDDRQIELLVEKCRNGPVAHCYAAWDADLMMLRGREVNG